MLTRAVASAPKVQYRRLGRLSIVRRTLTTRGGCSSLRAALAFACLFDRERSFVLCCGATTGGVGTTTDGLGATKRWADPHGGAAPAPDRSVGRAPRRGG